MPAKILLVEDDNNLREIYEARLQAEGYTISTAKDGEEALVVAKAQKPDLIISDVMMPRISGFEMLDILRNTDELKYTKVIMLTALGQAEDKTRAQGLGADRYLVKSQVTLEDIVKAAHELLDNLPAAAGTPETIQAAAPIAVPTDTTTPTAPTPEPAPTAPPVIEPMQPAPATPMADTSVAMPSVAPTPMSEPTPTGEAPMDTTPVPMTPAPEPTTTPATSQASAVDTDSLNPATAAEEQTAMNQQIEDFVNQQSSSAAPQVVTPKPIAPTDSTTAQDDAVLATALNDLSTSSTQIPSVAPGPGPAAVTSASMPTPAEPEGASSVTIANKKVIQPLDSSPKPNLDELMAAEEAKTATAAPAPAPNPTPTNASTPMPTSMPEPTAAGPTAEPGSTFAPGAAAPTPAPTSVDDPNNIAL